MSTSRGSQLNIAGDTVQAHEQLMREKAKMRALSEADHVKVEKQKFKLEQMSAKSQAHAYMKHLADLSAKVFPSEDMDSASATKSITHALTDDMSVSAPTRPRRPALQRQLLAGNASALRVFIRLCCPVQNNFDKGVKGKHAAYHHPHKPPLHLHHPQKPHPYHKHTPPSRMYTIGDPTPPLFTDSKKVFSHSSCPVPAQRAHSFERCPLAHPSLSLRSPADGGTRIPGPWSKVRRGGPGAAVLNICKGSSMPTLWSAAPEGVKWEGLCSTVKFAHESLT
jgi:hypothetical protein